MSSRSDTLGELAKALAKAKESFGPLVKGHEAKVPTRSGGEYSYTYASLANVLEATEPHLQANGLTLIQCAETEGGATVVETLLIHESGEWISSRLAMPSGNTPQGRGSAITYARRYAAQSMLGLAAEDDDGQSAAEAQRKEAEERRRQAEEERQQRDKLQGLRDAVRSRWRQLKASTPRLTWSAVCEAASVPTKGHTAYQLRRLNDHLKDELENAPETAEGDDHDE